MAEHLTKKSWKVTLVTGFPHYPEWEIHSSYQDKDRYFRECISGVNVMRYRHYVPGQPSFIKRIRQLIDFTFGSYFNLRKIGRADVVLSVIPFTSSAWLGNLFSRRLDALHWVHVQDFEFDAARESGMLGSKWTDAGLFKTLQKIESGVLDSADLVSTISWRMLSKLEKRTKSETVFFPNWLETELINPVTSKTHPHLKGNRFHVLYSGNIGAKQDWDVFTRVVKEFRENANLEFIVVGDGASRKWLESRVGGFPNVRILNPVPKAELNDLLCSADLHILLQKDNLVDTVMPSKLLGMMASEVPCLVSGNMNSEIAEIFRSGNCGYYVNSSDLSEIASTIQELMNSPQSSNEMGKNAREYVLNSFSKKEVLEAFCSKLESIYEN
jgi:colanic acid biosynthesis glycosyl transferase WcaI